MNTIFITEKILPDHGIEVLGFSPAWIDEDFNPDGVRVCWVDENGNWTSSKWDNDQDSYHTHSFFWCGEHGGTDFAPLYWMCKPAMPVPTVDAVTLIAKERLEQITKHDRTLEKDLKINTDDQLVHAAKRLLHGVGHESENFAPANWDVTIWKKMLNKPRRERLIIAAALIAAEIDRDTAEQNKK